MFEFPPARTEPKTTTNSPAGFSLAGVIFISGHGVSTILGYRVKSKWARGSRERGFSKYAVQTVGEYDAIGESLYFALSEDAKLLRTVADAVRIASEVVPSYIEDEDIDIENE